MFVYINIILLLLVGWLMLLLNSKYLQPALINKKRFRLFVLRDRLSLLAMRGELLETSLEYRVFIKLLNAAIKATGTFRVTDFLKYMFNWYSKERLSEESIEKIFSRMKCVDNSEYCDILADYFVVMQDIFYMQTRVLRSVLFPLLSLVYRLLSTFQVKIGSLEQSYREKADMVSGIDEKLSCYTREFQHQCAV